MLKSFKNSPLWLIGLFIIFAQGTAGVAAVQISGWPQAALVLFVISYSSVVTGVFFAFLWFKPENFYGPSEYGGGLSPASYANGLKGLPLDALKAVSDYEKDPDDNEKLFALMDGLLEESYKQHIVFIKSLGGRLDVSNRHVDGSAHSYEIVTGDNSFSVGAFFPEAFFDSLKGSDLIDYRQDEEVIYLTKRGREFADWLVRKGKKADYFTSESGGWGDWEAVKERLEGKFKGPLPPPSSFKGF